jgi:hypothetical protein
MGFSTITVFLPSGKEMARLELRPIRKGQESQQIPKWITVTSNKIAKMWPLYTDRVWGKFYQVSGSIGQRRQDQTCWVFDNTFKTVTFLEFLDGEDGGIEYSPSSPTIAALLELTFINYNNAIGAFDSMVPSGIKPRGTAKYAGNVVWTENHDRG